MSRQKEVLTLIPEVKIPTHDLEERSLKKSVFLQKFVENKQIKLGLGR
jgi:hypothetical protein